MTRNRRIGVVAAFALLFALAVVWTSASVADTPSPQSWADNNCERNFDRVFVFYLEENPDKEVEVDGVLYASDPIYVNNDDGDDTAIINYFRKEYDTNGNATGERTLYFSERLRFDAMPCPPPGANDYGVSGECDRSTGLVAARMLAGNGPDTPRSEGPDSDFMVYIVRSDGYSPNPDGFSFKGIPDGQTYEVDFGMIKPGRYVISIDQDGRLPRDKVRYRFIGCNPNEPEPPIKPSDPGDGEGADKAPPTVKFKPLSRARMRVIMRASIDKESKTSVWLKVKMKNPRRKRQAQVVLNPGQGVRTTCKLRKPRLRSKQEAAIQRACFGTGPGTTFTATAVVGDRRVVIGRGRIR